MSDIELNALGLLCPLPVLKAAKRLRSMEPGEVLALHADDPAAVVDVPHFCNETGHVLISSAETESGHLYRIQKKKDA